MAIGEWPWLISTTNHYHCPWTLATKNGQEPAGTQISQLVWTVKPLTIIILRLIKKTQTLRRSNLPKQLGQTCQTPNFTGQTWSTTKLQAWSELRSSSDMLKHVPVRLSMADHVRWWRLGNRSFHVRRGCRPPRSNGRGPASHARRFLQRWRKVQSYGYHIIKYD